MGRTLTALIAAGALVLAACGDDSGDDEDDSEETEETTDDAEEGDAEGDDGDNEVVDSGAGEDAAADETEEFCNLIVSQDLDALAAATPPEEIAEAWDTLMAEPENIDPQSDEAAAIDEWVSANCAPDGADGTDSATDPDETDTDVGDTGDGAGDDLGADDSPGGGDFMDDFCVDLPDGVDSDVAC